MFILSKTEFVPFVVLLHLPGGLPGYLFASLCTFLIVPKVTRGPQWPSGLAGLAFNHRLSPVILLGPTPASDYAEVPFNMTLVCKTECKTLTLNSAQKE